LDEDWVLNARTFNIDTKNGIVKAKKAVNYPFARRRSNSRGEDKEIDKYEQISVFLRPSIAAAPHAGWESSTPIHFPGSISAEKAIQVIFATKERSHR
jgi:hypothetical protein